MRWTRGHVSANVEDRRGRRGMRMPGRRGGTQIGCGGFLMLLLLSVVFKQDFFSLVGVGPGSGGVASTPTTDTSLPPGQDPHKELKEFVSFVLDDTQDVWTQKLNGYRPAKLVLFTDSVRSACGFAQAASGPFYCPGDQKVYIDLGFYQELSQRFGAPGDFAQAYVLAHEIGHHVQTLTGISTKVRRAQAQNPSQANDLSVRMELQADCLAGVWAHSTAQRNLLERGDIEEGMGAAAAVGDDRIQRMSGKRYINPESFTHGSAEQRMQWFRRGLDSGNADNCDTFG